VAAVLSNRREENERTHPLLIVSFVLFAAASLAGSIGGMQNGAIPRWVITPLRNLLALPLAAFIAYRIAYSGARLRVLLYTLIWASLASAVLVVVFIGGETQQIAAGAASFDELRSTGVSGDIGIIAGSALLFSLASGIHLFRRWLTILLMLVSLLGAFSLPHRSGWIVGAITFLYATYFVSRERFFRKALTGFVAFLLFGVIVWIAVGAISKGTGRDYSGYLTRRLESILPETTVRHENKPWDTRLPGVFRELELWSGNPIMGRGFGIQDVDARTHVIQGYRHNVWTSALVEGGPCELAAMLCVVFGLSFVGYRIARTSNEPTFVVLGAVASSLGVWAFLAATSSMTLNVQGPAIFVGVIFGAMLRVRALQLAGNHASFQQMHQANDEYEGEDLHEAMSGDPVEQSGYYY